MEESKKVGVALVGLGHYSSRQLAPALQETKNCWLAGIVTGSAEKARQWKQQYSLPEANIYDYEHFDAIVENPDIDVVYIVLPNAMHAEYTIRAARAGKHVICEKPMAVSVEECRKMIDACRHAHRLLSIGYRLHYEPHNLKMADLGRQERYGPVKKIVAKNEITVEPGAWRLDKTLAGGGPLMDVGIYCVQGAIYTIGKNPVAVTARAETDEDTRIFKGVERSMIFELEFPGGAVAECTCSYIRSSNLLRAEAENGIFELEPAYTYEGIKGKTAEGAMNLPQVNQQALQMDDFAACVLNGEPSRVPGEMGLRDLEILMAIYEASRTGEKVPLSHLQTVFNMHPA